MNPEALEELLLRIHSLPLDPAGWSGVVETTAELLSAQFAIAMTLEPRSASEFWCVPVNIDSATMAEYGRDWLAHDSWKQGARERSRMATGIVNLDDDLVDRRKFLRSPFFHDFLRKHDFDRFMGLCMVAPQSVDDAPQAVLSMMRGLGRPAFGAAEAALLKRIGKHFTVAATNDWRIRSLQAQFALRSWALDAVTHACLVIDRTSRVLMANAAAEDMLATESWLRIDRGRLTSGRGLTVGTASEALRALIAGTGSNVLLDADNGKEQRILVTMPFSRDTPTVPGMPVGAGIVWLIDVQNRNDTADRMAELFLFTRAETRVLRVFLQKPSLREVASRLEVSIHTVRHQLKSILQKSGRRSQGQLIALAARVDTLRGS